MLVSQTHLVSQARLNPFKLVPPPDSSASLCTPLGLVPKKKALDPSLNVSKRNEILSFPEALKSLLSEGTMYSFDTEFTLIPK